MSERMNYIKRTVPDLLRAMKEHADELEKTDTRHVYGVAMNMVRLQLEAIQDLEKHETQNVKLRGAVTRMTTKLQEFYTTEYIVHELINPTE